MNAAAVLTAGAVDAVRARCSVRHQRTGSANRGTFNLVTEWGK